jgi:hypothetical protein
MASPIAPSSRAILEMLRPFHCAVQDTQHGHGIAAMDVRHDVGEPANHELARTFDAAWSSDARMLGEHSYSLDDSEHRVDGRSGIVAGDIFFD